MNKFRKPARRPPFSWAMVPPAPSSERSFLERTAATLKSIRDVIVSVVVILLGVVVMGYT